MCTTTFLVTILDRHVISRASVLQLKTFARSSVNAAPIVSLVYSKELLNLKSNLGFMVLLQFTTRLVRKTRAILSTNQTRPITTWSPAFSRALGSLGTSSTNQMPNYNQPRFQFFACFLFTPSFAVWLFGFFFIDQRDHFGFSFTTLNKNVLKQPIRTAVSDVNDQLECESYARNPKRARGKRYWFCIW